MDKPAETDPAIVIYVDHDKIAKLTPRQRSNLMGRIELFLEAELPEAVGADVTYYWDTRGFELP